MKIGISLGAGVADILWASDQKSKSAKMISLLFGPLDSRELMKRCSNLSLRLESSDCNMLPISHDSITKQSVDQAEPWWLIMHIRGHLFG